MNKIIAIFLTMCIPLIGYTQSITGTVVDENGEPISFANVIYVILPTAL